MFTIYPLKIAICDNPAPRILYLGDPEEVIPIYNLMWVVMGDDKTILVDTGFDGDFARKYMPGMEQEPEDQPLRHFARLGVEPISVSDVILTHFHFDHLSPMLDLFKNATIHAQRKELITVCVPPHPWFAQFICRETVAKLVGEYNERINIIDNCQEIMPGIEVFWTGGHTPGHQSVQVETKAGRAVLCGDVVFTYRNIEEDIPCGFNSNLLECFEAMKEIRHRAEIILPGHEGQVFERYGHVIG